MALGGVPYYWSLIHNGESLMQNIDRMFFGKNAILREEFNELFYSLFKNPDRYIDVVRVLSARREGLTRQQISDQLKTTGGTLTRVLNNLERCDFILGYAKFGTKSSNTIYRLADPYTVFYFKFIANKRAQDELWWQHNINAPGGLLGRARELSVAKRAVLKALQLVPTLRVEDPRRLVHGAGGAGFEF